jgi:glycine hydroxymethyltransferase
MRRVSPQTEVITSPIGDPEVEAMLAQERAVEASTLQLIASENFTSPAVMAVTGSELTNRFTDGTPNCRTYGAEQTLADPEALACRRACALFSAEHANVQPHAGSVANFAVLLALARPGDTVMGMSMQQGGHLSHGQPINISGQMYRSVLYGVDPATELLDFDAIADLARRARPQLIFCGATAYPRIIDPEPFAQIASECGARMVFDAAHVGGLIAGKVHPNPVPVADVVTLTTHKTLRGPRGGAIVCRAEHAAAIDRAVSPGIQGGPLAHVMAAKAVTFAEAARPAFRAYARAVVDNARALAEALAARGLRVVTGGTDTHIVMVDLRSFEDSLSGREAEAALDAAGISVTACAVPADPRLPSDTSAIRVGPPALTTAGMGTPEMETVADLVVIALRMRRDSERVAQIRAEVTELCAAFPPYALWQPSA